jgi:hypothetical protein
VTAVSLDEIAEELVSACKTEGKKMRLGALKSILQTQILYDISLLTLIQGDLSAADERVNRLHQHDLRSIAGKSQAHHRSQTRVWICVCASSHSLCRYR